MVCCLLRVRVRVHIQDLGPGIEDNPDDYLRLLVCAEKLHISIYDVPFASRLLHKIGGVHLSLNGDFRMAT